MVRAPLLRERPAVQAFLRALHPAEVRDALESVGFRPA